jgi:ABC-type multidrug transport system ATPase subunit/pSer/pThr/pTyr-binding forkhead associated (FHA) protein
MKNFKFRFYQNDKLVKKLSFTGNESRTVSIGRKDSDVLLQVEGISRIHAQLLYDGVSVYIIDCNSVNGTFVNGIPLKSNGPVLLNKDDVVLFDKAGVTRLLVTLSDEKGEEAERESDFTKTIFRELIDKDEITIGRSPDCDIVLDHTTVSRRHATVKKTMNGKFIVTDEGSTNGVFINGKRIKKEEIGVNDKLYIGRFQLSLQTGQRNLSNESAIRVQGVTKTYRNGYQALKETTFDLPSGGVVAIMGPSGCGKSTLLKVLNGTEFPTSGNVYVNGLDLIENFPYLKTQIGYVPQDDIVHRELTVRQSIYYAAKIRLNGMSDELIEKKTESLLQRLNIKHISTNLVSAISGGQRKRVSIAVELLSDPAILFLDEPTSPLDPQTIQEFMEILRGLSKSGTTIIMVTHKPEDLNYMDRVIFMAEGGSLVFYGGVNEYKPYFQVATAIEVYSNISGERAPNWIRKFNEAILQQRTMPPGDYKREKEKTNPASQFYWLLSRYYQIKQNDRRNTLFMLLQAPIIAALLCLVFKEIKLGVLFLTSISAIWFGINNSAREIVYESAVYKRERMFNLLVWPYIFSKMVMLAAFALIQSFLFVTLIYAYYSTNSHAVHLDSWLQAVAWMFAITFCASLLGLFISSVNQTTEKAMSVVPVIIIPQIMLAGVLAIINSSIVELLSYFTISRWGTEGFTHMQKNVIETYTDPVKKIPVQQTMDAYVVMKKSFHETYQMTFGHYAGTFQLNAVILLFMSLIFLVLTWVFLVKKDKSQL